MSKDKHYRIPTIDEFVDGFEYEVLQIKKGDCIGGVHFPFDTSGKMKKHEKKFYQKEDLWVPTIKTTLSGICKMKMNDIIMTSLYIDKFDNYYQQPEYLQKLLDENRIRVKVK